MGDEGAGRLIVGWEGESVPPELRRLCARGWVAGVALFGRNIRDSRQLRELTAEIDALFPVDGLPPIVAVDQEGGMVQRLKGPAVPEVRALVSMREAMDRLDGDPVRLEALGTYVGEGLRAFGFNVDFAPVLDVDSNPLNPVIGGRAFGSTPERVVAGALPFARGLEAAGIAWCAKHFPGHGDTEVDSHLALPRLAHGRERLEAVELVPFQAAVEAGAPLVMTAHVVFSELDSVVPATLSGRVVPELLRGRLGYDGVVVSDDLEMGAIRGEFDDRAICAGLQAADIDLALVCRDLAWAEALGAELPASAASERRVRRLRAGLRRGASGEVPVLGLGLAVAGKL